MSLLKERENRDRVPRWDVGARAGVSASFPVSITETAHGPVRTTSVELLLVDSELVAPLCIVKRLVVTEGVRKGLLERVNFLLVIELVCFGQNLGQFLPCTLQFTKFWKYSSLSILLVVEVCFVFHFLVLLSGALFLNVLWAMVCQFDFQLLERLPS